MITARIAGTGSYLPKKAVSNQELESIVRNFDSQQAGKPFCQWVEEVTGIKTRYYACEDEDVESMATEAAKRALETANINSKELDFIIAASFTPSNEIPNLACTIASRLGNGNIPGFVQNAACAGFVYGLDDAYHRILSGKYKNILVVAGEVLTKVTDFGDPKTAVLFGDGAGAVVLTKDDKGAGIINSYLCSDYSPEHINLGNSNTAREEKEYVKKSHVKMEGGGHVLKKAVNAMADAVEKVLEGYINSEEEKGGIKKKLEEIKLIIPHQANARIVKGLAEKLNVPMAKVCLAIDKFGNTSAATIPIALDKIVRGELEGYSIKRGDKIILTAVGAGYSIGAILMEY